MKLKMIPITELNAAEYNPRIKLEKGMPEYEKLKSSIQEFGFVDPPIFNIQTKNLVGGHQRVQVVKDLGFTEINVSIVDMPLEREKQLNIALNKISGHWDETKLTELLESFNSTQLELSGFSDVELTDLIDSMNKPMRLADKVKNNPINSNLFDSFLFPPFSYLDTKSKRWLDRKNLWKSIGIKSELGRDDNLVFNDNLKAPGLEGTSIFDPVLCELAYRWFTPYKNSNILDPFAGGSVRGITANIIGHNYNGIDLRKEQVEANYKNADEIGLSNINWVCDDSLNMSDHFNDGSMDLVFTCPPYFDLEIYSDDKSDISNMDYVSFEKVYAAILRNASMKLKENRFAIVIISDVRDNKGFYRDLTGLTKKSFADEGLFFYNDLILLNTAGSAALRARQSMNNRKIVRIHQNVLVFYKGNLKEIKNHFEPLKVLENDLETLLDSLEE